MAQTIEQRIEEILNRKPSRWVNMPFNEFKKDISLLTETFREQQSTISELQNDNLHLLTVVKECNEACADSVHIQSVESVLDEHQKSIDEMMEKYRGKE